MIAIFILAVLSILVAGMASYTVYTSIKSSEMLTMIGRNASQMDGISAALKSSIRALSSFDAASNSYTTRLFLPTPDVDAPAAPAASFVPSWIMSNPRTPWGAFYAYCAYAPEPLGGPLGSSAATTPLPYASNAGDGIPSATHDLTSPDGSVRSYMVGGARPPNAGDETAAPPVLGFVISPSFGSDTPPSCGAVAWRGGGWRVAGGIVSAITDDAATRNAIPTPAIMTRYVSPGGGGDGGSAMSAATLSDVLAEWKAARPASAVINLSSGSHTLAPSEFNLSDAGRMSGHTLRFEGSPGAKIVNSGAAAALTSDADLVLDGISLDAKISLWAQPGTRFQTRNSSLRYVFVDGGDMTIGQGASVTSASADVAAGLPGTASIDVAAGRLTIRDSSAKTIGGSMPAAISAEGSFVSLQAGSLAATGTGTAWVKITGGSRIATGGTSSITWNGTAVEPPAIGLSATAQRTVETTCSETPCVARCNAEPAAAGRSWFALSGSCSAAQDSGISIAVTESGVLPNADPSALPSDWQCRFASVATDDVPAPPLPAIHGVARAICAPVPAQ